MRLTQVGAPVTSSHRDDAQLRDDDGSADSSCDFLGGLDTETDVTLGVTNDDNGLESGSLTGTGLLLDGLDLYFVKKKSRVSVTVPGFEALLALKKNLSLSPCFASQQKAAQPLRRKGVKKKL